jgi:hypothetical protein
MTRKTGLEHMKGNIKINERLKNFFGMNGFNTDFELDRKEVDDEVRLEIEANNYFKELDEREEKVLNDINNYYKTYIKNK